MTESASSPKDFVGGGHRALVDFLESRLDAVIAGESVARLIVLSAGSGSGKSRVVRELYERLRLREDLQPRSDAGEVYWPPLPETVFDVESGGIDFTNRKVIGPDLATFVRPPGTVPGFFWLQVRCDQKAGDFSTPIDSILKVLHSHRDFLDARLKDVSSKAKIKGISELSKKTLLGAAKNVADIAIPGISSLAEMGIDVGKTIKRNADVSRSIKEGGELSAPTTTADMVFEQIKEICNQKLPVIIAVEDAHLLDTSFSDLLRLIISAERSFPILVVATSWPENSDWLETMTGTDSTKVEIFGDGGNHPFPELAVEDRASIVKSFAPLTDESVLLSVARRWTTPYSLLLAMTSKKMQRQIHNANLEITPAALNQIPTALERLYEDRWDALDPEVQTALMFASGTVPHTSNEIVSPFVVEIVQKVLEKSKFHGGKPINPEAFRKAVKPLGWTRQLDDEGKVLEFREWLLAQVAFEKFREEIDDDNEIVGFLDDVASELEKEVLGFSDGRLIIGEPSSAILTICSWLVTLKPESTSRASNISVFTLARDAYEKSKYEETLALFCNENRSDSIFVLNEEDYSEQIALRRTYATTLYNLENFNESVREFRCLLELSGTSEYENEFDNNTILNLRFLLADSLKGDNQYDEAVEEFRNLLLAEELEFGREHEEPLGTRFLLSQSLVAAERFDEAIYEFRELLGVEEDVLGREHEEPFTTRWELAKSLVVAERFDEAIYEFRELLSLEEALYGVEHKEPLSTRFRIAICQIDAGHLSEAIETLRKLIQIESNLYGEKHEDTLVSRARLCGTLTKAGEHVQAIAHYQELIPHLVEVYGENHENTLRTKAWFADAMSSCGQFDIAVDLFNDVITAGAEYLDPSHDVSLGTPLLLGDALIAAGRSDEAVEVFYNLIAIEVRVYGKVHKDSLVSRFKLSRCLTQAGRFDEAILEFRGLILDEESLYSSDHQEPLSTRYWLARCLYDAGRIDEAIAEFKVLIPLEQEVLGDKHKDVLSSRYWSAHCLYDAGRIDEAIAEFKVLIPLQQEVLGDKHEDVLESRYWLARYLTDAGRFDEAISEFNALIPLQQEVLGDKHKDVLSSRYSLAHCLDDAGRFDEAISEFNALIPLQQEVLGDKHEDVLSSRYWSAHCLHTAGRFDEAITEFESLIPLQQKMLGVDHEGVLWSRYFLASALTILKRYPEARLHLEEALEIRLSNSDENDEGVKNIREALLDIETKTST